MGKIAALSARVAEPSDDRDTERDQLSCQKSQQVSPLDEDTWHRLMARRRDKWKAREADTTLTRQQRRYAGRRARRLDRPYAERLAGCNRRGVAVKCGCPGRRDVRWYSCRQHLVCTTCQKRRAKRMGARIRAGLEAAIQREPRMMVVLITISVRHSGDIEADRRALASGWRRYYKSYHREHGAFTYCGTHEITPGTDQLGHPHAHIVALWPFRDWSREASRWRAACPESTRISFVASRSVRGAAKYVSKYVSKGIQTDDFSPVLRARILAGTYQTRWLMTSVRFWQPFVPLCPCCKQPIVRAMLSIPWKAYASENCRRSGADTGSSTDPTGPAQLALETLYKA